MSWISKLLGRSTESRVADLPEYTPAKLTIADAGQCPYCQSEVRPAPKRKKKCPSCAKPIIVRTRQGLFPTPFLTEDQAFAVDHFAKIADYGLREPAFFAVVKRQERKTGTSDVRAAVWELAESLTHASHDLETRKMACFHLMWMAFHMERDWVRPAIEMNQLELDDISRSFRRVTILGTACCSTCERDDGLKLSIKKARQTNHLPHVDCEDPPCRCCYSADTGLT